MIASGAFLQGIKIVGFDFDQTLVDEAFSVRTRWAATLTEFKHLSPELEATFLKIFEEKGYRYKTHLNEALAKLNLSETEHLMPILERFRASQSETEKVYDSAPEAVSFFKEHGMRVGIITDGIQSYQEDRLKKSGLYEHFDFVYYGDMHKKPDPAFFQTVLDDEQVAPHELLFIGDHVQKDIAGALGVGAKAVWIAEGSTEKVPHEALYFKNMYTFLTWLKQ